MAAPETRASIRIHTTETPGPSTVGRTPTCKVNREVKVTLCRGHRTRAEGDSRTSLPGPSRGESLRASSRKSGSYVIQSFVCLLARTFRLGSNGKLGKTMNTETLKRTRLHAHNFQPQCGVGVGYGGGMGGVLSPPLPMHARIRERTCTETQTQTHTQIIRTSTPTKPTPLFFCPRKHELDLSQIQACIDISLLERDSVQLSHVCDRV